MTGTYTQARGIGGPLDLGVAALAAGSIGFVAFAMPTDLFSSLIGATHLPDLVAAAAPPLGMKARYAVMGGAAALVFLIVWSLMRALDAAPAVQAAPKPVKREDDPDAPRLRRADAHPDAPARRPLFAGADLGEPGTETFDLITPAPDYGDDWREAEFAPEPEPEHEPVPAARMPRFMSPQAPEPEPERNPVVPPAQKKSFEAPAAGQASGNPDSIGTLMHRLERGLADREEPQAPPPVEPDLPAPLAAASANPEASLSPEGVRHRLRSAISDLNQHASRG